MKENCVFQQKLCKIDFCFKFIFTYFSLIHNKIYNFLPSPIFTSQLKNPVNVIIIIIILVFEMYKSFKLLFSYFSLSLLEIYNNFHIPHFDLLTLKPTEEWC